MRSAAFFQNLAREVTKPKPQLAGVECVGQGRIVAPCRGHTRSRKVPIFTIDLTKSDQAFETKAVLSHVTWNEPFPHGVCEMRARTPRENVMSVWSTIREEMREVVWLASVVGGLSTLGVGLAVAAAFALDGWPMRLLGHV